VYEDFNRIEKLKDILFDINKDEDDMINFNDFIKTLNLRNIYLDNEKYPEKTYYDVLFY
jgi:hypothetical protein